MEDEIEKEPNKKEIEKQSNIQYVIYTIKPILIFENLFGIIRFGVVNNELKPVSVSKKIGGILIASLYLAFSYLIYEGIFKIYHVSNTVQIIGTIPSIVVIIQYVACIIASSLLVCERTRRILYTVADLDSKLRINVSEDFYEKSRIQLIKILIIFIIVHIVCTSVDFFSTWTTLTGDFLFLAGKIIMYLMYLEQNLQVFVVCTVLYLLTTRLRVINEYLSVFIYEKDENRTPIFIINEKEIISDKQFNFIGRISASNMKIRDLADMYNTLGETCYLVNDVFQFQIFMNLVSTFTYVVITIWTSIYFYRNQENGADDPIFNVVNWCLLTILSVAVLCFICENLLTVRNKTQLLVNEIIMDYDLPRSMRIQAKVFMELIHAWPLKMFVYDMFSIDIKLMLKFISVATTYLILIIQISHFEIDVNF